MISLVPLHHSFHFLLQSIMTQTILQRHKDIKPLGNTGYHLLNDVPISATAQVGSFHLVFFSLFMKYDIYHKFMHALKPGYTTIFSHCDAVIMSLKMKLSGRIYHLIQSSI